MEKVNELGIVSQLFGTFLTVTPIFEQWEMGGERTGSANYLAITKSFEMKFNELQQCRNNLALQSLLISSAQTSLREVSIWLLSSEVIHLNLGKTLRNLEN